MSDLFETLDEDFDQQTNVILEHATENPLDALQKQTLMNVLANLPAGGQHDNLEMFIALVDKVEALQGVDANTVLPRFS